MKRKETIREQKKQGAFKRLPFHGCTMKKKVFPRQEGYHQRTV